MDITQRAAFETSILAILAERPQGISEYDLMRQLAASGYTAYERAALQDPLQLFQQHFLLFHSLYRLRRILWRDEHRWLEIGPLCIVAEPARETARQALGRPDPLAEYYLNLDELTRKTRADVDELLTQFWRRYCGREQHEAALAVLGLDASADRHAIKQRYRRLAMQHHPDRGGDSQTLQRIHAALRTLLGTSKG